MRNYNISANGVDFIKKNEGLQLIAYPDGKGLNAGYSIGYGHYLNDLEQFQYTGGNGQIMITKQIADYLLDKDINDRVQALNSVLNVDVSQPTFDALIDYGFSMSPTTLKNSTLVKLINEGKSNKEISEHWLKSFVKYGSDYNYKPLKERREKEVDMFNSTFINIAQNVGLNAYNSKAVPLVVGFGGLAIFTWLVSKIVS